MFYNAYFLMLRPRFSIYFENCIRLEMYVFFLLFFFAKLLQVLSFSQIHNFLLSLKSDLQILVFSYELQGENVLLYTAVVVLRPR